MELVHKVSLLDRGGVTGNYITLRYTCCNDAHHTRFPSPPPPAPIHPKPPNLTKCRRKIRPNNIIASNTARLKSLNCSDSCLKRSVNSVNLSPNGNKCVYMECANNVKFRVFVCCVFFRGRNRVVEYCVVYTLHLYTLLSRPTNVKYIYIYKQHFIYPQH